MDAAYTGNTISRLRKELGLTQKELAEKLHVTDKAVSKWERGINFPDLGLLEHLAHHLGTTPAVLLGLEESGPDELLHSMAELSARQLEEARKSLGRIGWGCILTGAVLFLTYQWIPRQTVLAYQSLHILITVILFGGIWLLFRYGEIKSWGPEDLFIALGALFPGFLFVFIQFVTGYSPNPLFGTFLIGASGCFTQWLCCRIFRAWLAKISPLLISGIWGLRLLISGIKPAEMAAWICCCAAVWIAHCFRRKQKQSQP